MVSYKVGAYNSRDGTGRRKAGRISYDHAPLQPQDRNLLRIELPSDEAVKTSQIERELLDRCADNRPSTS